MGSLGSQTEVNEGTGGSRITAMEGAAMKRSKNNKDKGTAKLSAIDALAEALQNRRAQYSAKLKRHWESHDKSPLPVKSR